MRVLRLDRPQHAAHRGFHRQHQPAVPVRRAQEAQRLLTLGILWAVANLDKALLDDVTLSDSRGQLTVYEQLPRSAAGREIAAELDPVSRMWLGSQSCASHILRHTDTLTDVPAFWTPGEAAPVVGTQCTNDPYSSRPAPPGMPVDQRPDSNVASLLVEVARAADHAMRRPAASSPRAPCCPTATAGASPVPGDDRARAEHDSGLAPVR
ncbi:hypothetical protein F4560_003086 [Saccharothrix ecbatanensis]|uniref:Uncharacterized protein n=1 Tax=Saccharothrix ecbatanensis TaxID=1105145 RepID=A0A7W9HJY3_9PSEU|nr:hypothetical protein [Saccharothrix ecbatanensis]MBB5803318.1 hypothetical protein [Saccharothrix ecbatanensis]